MCQFGQGRVPLLRLSAPVTRNWEGNSGQRWFSNLVVGLQLLARRLRQLPQFAAGAAEGDGDARVEHVAQLDED